MTSYKYRQNHFWQYTKNLTPFILFLAGYLIVPRYANDEQFRMLIFIGINAMLALGLNLLMGYAGQISLGHAAFFGIGAYTSAILTIQPIQADVIPGLAYGLGIVVGCAMLMSLTGINGWRLAVGIAALILLSWLIRLVPMPVFARYIVFIAGMAGFGAAVKAGWWKCAISGIVTVFVIFFCGSSLRGILENGGTSPWNAMLVGIILTSVIAYLIGAQVLRLKGHYLAMGTLGFGMIIEIVFRQWTSVTGGSSDGIYGIPGIEIVNKLPVCVRGFLGMTSGKTAEAMAGVQEYFYLVWALVFVAIIIATNIVRSRVGRAMMSVHGSEIAAESLGVDTERFKVQTFVLSAGLASLAGSLYAHNAGIGYINPSEFGLMTSIQMVVMVVVGGMASVWGSIAGAGVIQILKTWLLTIERSDIKLYGLEIKGLDPIVFGAVLVIVMIVLPQGVARGLSDGVSSAVRLVFRRSKHSGKEGAAGQ